MFFVCLYVYLSVCCLFFFGGGGGGGGGGLVGSVVGGCLFRLLQN